MNIEDLLDLLRKWLESTPSIRGHRVEDAELRLRFRGEGRLAVRLQPEDPPTGFRELERYMVALLEAARAERDGVEKVERPTTPDSLDLSERAFADFACLGELERMLRGEEPAQFHFDDEVEPDIVR